VLDGQQKKLLSLIKAHPQGMKEYDLLMLLRKQQSIPPPAIYFDNLALFEQHFLLFHALYKLNDQLCLEQGGHLTIEALNIQWSAHHPQPAPQLALYHADPLRNYYLDIKNLENTSSSDVDALLASFWIRMSDDSDKFSALALFELTEPCDLKTVKKRYRQLLARHHPDKGGSLDTAQALNDAMAVLKRYYSAGTVNV